MRRLLHPLYRKLETNARPLRYLFIEITGRCNLKCLHCGSDCKKEAVNDELTTKEWLEFFDYLAKKFDRQRMVLVITGGEPLCHPELSALLGALKAKGFAYGIVTNGYALTERNPEKLVAMGVQSVTVSLDGLEASHDWLRGVSGSYKRALGGISRLAKLKLPFLDVVTCANPRNIEELRPLMEVIRGAGVKYWRIFSIFPKGRAKDNKELLLDDGQFIRLLEWIAKTRKELEGSDFTLQYSCEGYLPPELDAAVREEPYFCRAGISIASVLADGTISACPNISRELAQGNIRRDDFKDVWENRFQKFSDRAWLRTGQCKICKEWSRCLGNSLHLWDGEEGQRFHCLFTEHKSYSKVKKS